MAAIKDGQHRWDGKQYNCFFCQKDAVNCRAVMLPKRPEAADTPFNRLYEKHLDVQFVGCSPCWAKGQTYLIELLCNYLQDKYDTIRLRILTTGVLDAEARSLMTEEEIKQIQAKKP